MCAFFSQFRQFHQFILDEKIKYNDLKLTRVLKNIDFISEKIDISNNENIFKKFKEASAIIISMFSDSSLTENHYIIIGFKQTLMIVDSKFLSFLLPLFKYKSDLNIQFESKAKNIFDFSMNIKYQEIKSNITEKKFYESMKQHFNKITECKNEESANLRNKIWPIICPCILKVLFKESYSKINRASRFNGLPKVNNNDEISEPQILMEGDFIELDTIGSGSSFKIILAYLIEKGELIVIKRPYKEDIAEKLTNREISNYSKLNQFNHPFLPRFIGLIQNDDPRYPPGFAIEFINGQSLLEINKMNLNINEKLTIIFELILAIEFIHHKGFIHRDLKLSNLMIDQNKDLVLIDFDNMILINNETSQEVRTSSFSSVFVANEINEGKCSDKSDVYSLGKIIYSIITGKSDIKSFTYNSEFTDINEICIKCTNEKEDLRPPIFDLIIDFYIKFIDYIRIKNVFRNNKEYFSEVYNEIEISAMEDLEYNQSESNDENNNNNNNDNNDNNGNCSMQHLIDLENEIKQKQNNIMNRASDIMNRTSGFLNNFFNSDGFNSIFGFLNGDLLYASGALFEKSQDFNKAIEYYTKAANEHGHSESMHALGLIYSDEDSVHFDINEAIKYYTRAAGLNHLDSLYNLGLIYYDGKNVIRDINKTIKYFTQAANQNHIDSLYGLGIIYYDGKYVKQDINKSIEYFKQAANLNHANSLFQLGYIYEIGKSNVKPDIMKSVHYYRLASEQNHINSQCRLANIYRDGKDNISRDIDKAIHFYGLAAEQGDSMAHYNLGIIYTKEEEHKKNIKKGIEHLIKASDLGYVQAQNYLGCIFQKGQIVQRDIKKAIHYFNLAAKQKCPNSLYTLGQIYENGDGVKPDIEKAINYYMRALEEGKYDLAGFKLGTIYLSSFYVPHDTQKAIYYYKIAAKMNHTDSQYTLGTIFEDIDINESIKYFKQAAENGSSDAECMLGLLYYYGEKVELDLKKALTYLKSSALKNNEQAQFCLGLIYFHGKFKYVFQDVKSNKKDNKILRNSIDSSKQNTGKYDKEAFDKEANDKDINDKDINDKDINGKDINGKGINGKDINDKGINGKDINGKDINDKDINDKDINGKDINDKDINGKDINDKDINGKDINDKDINDKDINDKDINDKDINDKQDANSKNKHIKFIIPIDFSESFKYFTLSAKKGWPLSIYYLSFFYLFGLGTPKNYNYAICLLKYVADKHHNSDASFLLGYFYHKGKYLKSDIEKAIHYYNLASSLNNPFAKNNLGIIYKYQQKYNISEEFFKEAIRINENLASPWYNLAHIYLYNLGKIKQSINILYTITSIYDLDSFRELLCLAIIKDFNFNYELVQKDFIPTLNESHRKLISMLNDKKFYQKNIFEEKFAYYKDRDYIYSFPNRAILSNKIINQTENQQSSVNNMLRNLTRDFYEGFAC